MTLLTKSELLQLQRLSPPLVENLVDPEKQFQPAGIDVSLAKILTARTIHVERLADAKNFFLNELTEVPFGTVLYPGNPYILITNEVFHMPLSLTSVLHPRSSLTRLGASIGSGVVDAGYNGTLNASLILTLPLILEKNERFAQALFYLHRETDSYRGQYQSIVVK